MNVHTQTKSHHGDFRPVIVVAIIAVLGTAGIINNLRPGKISQDSGDARMVSAAAVARAGAIEIPSQPST